MFNSKLVFLCGARDYHAMDWYKSAKVFIKDKEVVLLTDLIGGEGFDVLINDSDRVYKLLVIDRLLFSKQSNIGNKWRNLIKLLLIPIQVFLLKKFYNRYPKSIFHAHGMYYMFLAALAKVPYIGTPQGSELLVRPFKSQFYFYFARIALKRSKSVTVDSLSMAEKAKLISNIQPKIIQNGIDIDSIFSVKLATKNITRTKYCSSRAITPLYRNLELIKARNESQEYNVPIHFFYPFVDEVYKSNVELLFGVDDKDVGRLPRDEMYKLLFETKVVFSIPYSDSSPRSVYEAIFCGCVVVITENPYYTILPECMKSRIIIVDIENKGWFDDAIKKSEEILKIPYIPSKDALTIFDQKKSFQILSQLYR